MNNTIENITTNEMNNTECKQSTILEIMAENTRLKRENVELKYYKTLYNNPLHNEVEVNEEEVDKPVKISANDDEEEEYARLLSDMVVVG